MFSNVLTNFEKQFFEAVRTGNLPIVTKLLNNKSVSISVKDPFSWKQGIHIACEFKQIAILETLLKFNADVNAKTSREFTPLHVAAQQNDKNCLIILIKADENIFACLRKPLLKNFILLFI